MSPRARCPKRKFSPTTTPACPQAAQQDIGDEVLWLEAGAISGVNGYDQDSVSSGIVRSSSSLALERWGVSMAGARSRRSTFIGWGSNVTAITFLQVHLIGPARGHASMNMPVTQMHAVEVPDRYDRGSRCRPGTSESDRHTCTGVAPSSWNLTAGESGPAVTANSPTSQCGPRRRSPSQRAWARYLRGGAHEAHGRTSREAIGAAAHLGPADLDASRSPPPNRDREPPRSALFERPHRS